METIACTNPIDVNIIKIIVELIMKGKSHYSLVKVLLNGISNQEQLQYIAGYISQCFMIPIERANEIIIQLFENAKLPLTNFIEFVVTLQLS